MTIKKKMKSKMLVGLRNIGLLCKRPVEPEHRIRISKTINPDGSVTEYDKLTKQPIFEGNTFETELHIWKEIHKQNR